MTLGGTFGSPQSARCVTGTAASLECDLCKVEGEVRCEQTPADPTSPRMNVQGCAEPQALADRK